MPQSHGNKRFVMFIRVKKGTPFHHIAPTNEIEHPWRVCPDSHIIRYWPGKAIVTGKWQKANANPYHSLLRALQGHEIPEEEEESKNIMGDKRISQSSQSSSENVNS